MTLPLEARAEPQLPGPVGPVLLMAVPGSLLPGKTHPQKCSLEQFGELLRDGERKKETKRERGREREREPSARC